jgi:predicted small metal-binding protein
VGLSFACRDVGVTDCRHVADAATEDELVAAVAEHARTAHGVELNETLLAYAKTKVRSS